MWFEEIHEETNKNILGKKVQKLNWNWKQTYFKQKQRISKPKLNLTIHKFKHKLFQNQFIQRYLDEVIYIPPKKPKFREVLRLKIMYSYLKFKDLGMHPLNW